jgi:hypothetical protein
MSMPCTTALELLSGELDGRLSSDESVALQAHLTGCAGCAARRSQLRALKQALRGLAADEGPAPSLRERLTATYAPSPRAPRRRRWPLGAGLAGLAAAAALLLVLADRGRSLGGAGEHRFAEQATLALAGRGVAVGEAGAELRWVVERDGAAHITQSHGDVFYRVERGGAFVVETPAGRVSVRGTCFRVEVRAADAVVTVLEGRVAVESAGELVELTPGMRALLSVAAAPRARRVSAASEEASLPALASPPSAPPPSPSPVETGRHVEPHQKFFGFTSAELVEMAQRCQVTYDLPLYDLSPALLSDGDAAAAGLSDSERQAYNALLQRHSDTFMGEVRALHQELTGQPGGELAYRALEAEIFNKSIPDHVAAARARLSAERAGQAVAPSAAEVRPPVERFLRLGLATADAFEADVLHIVGAERARALRRTRFQVVWSQGCPAP